MTGEFFGLDFAGFHVRLVERVDTNDRAGHGRGDFPAEKLLAERVHVRKSNSNHGMPRFFNRRNRCVLSFVRFICQTQVDENSVTSIHAGLREFFAVHRNNSLADFSGGFGNQLFEPGAQIGNSRRSDDGDLVAAVVCGDAKNVTEKHAWVGVRGRTCTASLHHLLGRPQKFTQLHAHRSGWDHTEIRKRGVAAADTGIAGKNLPEFVVFGHLLHF